MSASDVTLSPSDVTLSPSDVTLSPSDVNPSPSDVTLSPSDVTPSPSDVTLSPSDVTLSPSDVTLSPSDVTLSLSKGEPAGDLVEAGAFQTELVETGGLQQSLEAVLFVAGEALSIDALAKLTAAPHVAVAEALAQMSEDYAERGIVLREVAGGYRFATSPAARAAVEAYLLPAKTNLSGPAMETLAIVAYLQPVTRAEIEAVRGVNVDSVVSTLVDRRFIVESGRREVPGRPMEYRTTPEFLESFGLRSLAELPPVDLDAESIELTLPIVTEASAVDTAREAAEGVVAEEEALASRTST